MASDYRNTLSLFTTSFPIRPDFSISDEKVIAFWYEHTIVNKFFTPPSLYPNEKVFILHDGPPFANGETHIGGAYNKIIKDIIIKSKQLLGYSVRCIPGWDCHGLPIEQKIEKTALAKDRAEFISYCRTWASSWIEKQKKTFQSLGVFMEWDKPYFTMDFSYEATIVRSLATLVEKGYVYRAKKTVPWCCTCHTALSSAEIEYKELKDPSVYLLFPLVDSLKLCGEEGVEALVWTTTPWTLPLNRAVALKEGYDYCIVLARNKKILVGVDAIKTVFEKYAIPYTVVKTIPASSLKGASFLHPFDVQRTVPLLIEPGVASDEGTACVHIAPGCGPIDYEYGIKQGLEIYSPLTDDGCYDEGIIPHDLKGKSIFSITDTIINSLQARDLLWHAGTIVHSYPHCWRSKSKLVFRATPQWFFDLRKDDIKEKTLKATKEIAFFPPNSRAFLESALSHRWEWCISRQRRWGVPIPAFFHRESGEVFVSPEFIRKVAAQIEKHGIEWWSTATTDTLLQLAIIDAPTKERLDSAYEKEDDILDVWFDSGVSHSAVLQKQELFPADLYVEGVDQHRGWFQSSVITSVALHGTVPMKNIISHGYIIDKNKEKMSKSIGNVIYPHELIKKYGVDTLRLWAAMVGYEGDIAISEKILENSAEIYRKIRNTCRFILQNIADSTAEEMKNVDQSAYTPIEHYMIVKNEMVKKSIASAYEKFDLSRVVSLLNEYAHGELSTLYFDITKDVLYCNAPQDKRRKAVQRVLWSILDTLVAAMRPIMSCTAELLYREYRGKNGDQSVFLDHALWNESSSLFLALEKQGVPCYNFLSRLIAVRTEVHRYIESNFREKGLVKQSAEMDIVITYKGTFAENDQEAAYEKCIAIEECCRELFQVASVTFVTAAHETEPPFRIEGKKTEKEKCERCWRYFDRSLFHKARGLCTRCVAIVPAP